MKKLVTILLLLCCGFSIAACNNSEDIARTEKRTLAQEEVQSLKEVHPEFFGLDTTNGLNVLVFDNAGQWVIRFVPGSKNHYALKEVVEATLVLPLTLDEAKSLLVYYDLPDDKVVLRPYQDEYSYLMKIDDSLIQRISDAFDHRYLVGEEFKKYYDPAIDTISN